MEILVLMIAFVALCIYMMPTIIANSRGHQSTLTIGLLNLVAGWTVLGWIGCLAWACTTVSPRGARELTALQRWEGKTARPMPSGSLPEDRR